MEINFLVSIIMPLYNGETYVSQSIESIKRQTYTNWELIIVDDGSCDKSLSIAKRYENEKIKVFTQENKGASAARNFGFVQSSGSFVKFFDADDLINPEMLEKQIKLAHDSTDCIISAKWGRFYNDDLSTFKFNPEDCWQNLPSIDWICKSWQNAQSMTQPGIFLLPRNLVEKAGLWDERLSLIDDLEYFTRTILNAKSIIFCEEACLYYRSGIKNNLSSKKSLKALQSAILSAELSINHLLAATNNKITRLLSANCLQMLVFEYFLIYPELITPIELKIKQLGGSNLQYPGGRTATILVTFLGWKNVKRLKFKLNKIPVKRFRYLKLITNSNFRA